MNNDKTSTPPINSELKHYCRKCGEKLVRIPRTVFMKYFLFWLSLRNYICYRCFRRQWRIVKDMKETRSK
jgi:hypothetical protein